MTIAIISDIHANLPALEAVLKDIDKRKPAAIYCLGDLVGYNTWPNEVIKAIRQRGIATIAGNHDLKVEKSTGEKIDSESLNTKNYAYNIVGEPEKRYLLTLPAHIRLEFKLNDDTLNLLFVHGSPRKVDEYLLQDMDEAVLLDIMQQANADVLCFGHSHKPYHRVLQKLNEGETYYRHAINAGSVGKPKDGDARACYVLLSISEQSSTKLADSIGVEFVRVAYDIEKAVEAISNSPLPKELADMLRKAY
jgi:putative phosphoesterase